MPLAHAIRRWLWRLNGVLLLCVVAAWGWVLFARPDASLFDVEGVDAAEGAPEEETRTTWSELKAVFGPF